MRSIDIDTVLDRRQLRDVTMNDDELMRDILATLIDDTSRQMRLLNDAVREENPQKCMRLAHSSKGACANVGANRAAEILRRIEVKAATSQFTECEESLRQLALEVDLLRVEIASELLKDG